MTTIEVLVGVPGSVPFEITATPSVVGDGLAGGPGRGHLTITMIYVATGATIGIWTNIGAFSTASTQLGLTWDVATGSTTDVLTVDIATTPYLKGPVTISVPSSDLLDGSIGVFATFSGIPDFASSVSSLVPL